MLSLCNHISIFSAADAETQECQGQARAAPTTTSLKLIIYKHLNLPSVLLNCGPSAPAKSQQ